MSVYRKPRRWIEHFRIELRFDKHHRALLTRLGFTEYCEMGAVALRDDEAEEFSLDPRYRSGLMRVPKLPRIEPYGD